MRLFPEGAALEWYAALFWGGNDSRQMGACAALYYIERSLAAGRVRPIGRIGPAFSSGRSTKRNQCSLLVGFAA